MCLNKIIKFKTNVPWIAFVKNWWTQERKVIYTWCGFLKAKTKKFWFELFVDFLIYILPPCPISSYQSEITEHTVGERCAQSVLKSLDKPAPETNGCHLREKINIHVWLFATPCTVACQAPLSMGIPDKNTGVGCHSLLQGVFMPQGLNLGLLHCRHVLYHLSHQESPKY